MSKKLTTELPTRMFYLPMYHPDKYPYVWGYREKKCKQQEEEKYYEYEEINGFLRIKKEKDEIPVGV